jgi:hypothetical protein
MMAISLSSCIVFLLMCGYIDFAVDEPISTTAKEKTPKEG